MVTKTDQYNHRQCGQRGWAQVLRICLNRILLAAVTNNRRRAGVRGMAPPGLVTNGGKWKSENQMFCRNTITFIPQHYHDHPILALAPPGRHGAVAGRVYGRHHGRQVVGPRPGAGGGQGGRGRHPALQRGELQPGPVQGSTRLSAEGRYKVLFK